MRKWIFHILFLCLAGDLSATNYIEYQRIFNRVDEAVLDNKYSYAIHKLDSVYKNYDFIFAKHCVKALQICVVANDSIRADKWLEKCFKQGVPLWIIRTNEITQKSLNYSTTLQTQWRYNELHEAFLRSIDTNLANTIDSLLKIDQEYTWAVNESFVLFRVSVNWVEWEINNQRQLKLLKEIIENKGFPGEKLIGPGIPDSSSFAKYFTFWGPGEIRQSSVQIMLQHCYSSFPKMDLTFKSILYQNLLNGNLPAFQFSIICDFMGHNQQDFLQDRYDIPEKNIDPDEALTVNRNRYSVGLNSLEQSNRNLLLNRERRRNKKANSEIMLE